MRKGWISGLAAVCLLALPVAAQEDGGVTIVGGDEASLRAFVERMLAPVFAPTDQGAVTLTLNALPEGFALPDGLTLPEDATIVGSTTGLYGMAGSVQIFFNTDRSVAELLSATQEALETTGWTDQSGQFGGGFIATGQGVMLCNVEAETAVWLQAAERSGVTAAQLNVNTGENAADACSSMSSGSVSDEIRGIIPLLEAPEGSTMGETSGGGSNTLWYYSTRLESAQMPGELELAYADQLAADGWTLVGRDALDDLAVSRWQVAGPKDSTYEGVLLVMNTTTEGIRYAMISVQPISANE